MSIGYGILAFAPLGPGFAPQAAMIGVHTAVFAGFFAALFGGTAIQITGPKAPITLAMAALVVSLEQHSGLLQSPATVIGLVSLCVFLAGGWQIFFGAVGLSGLVKYIPQPVISGFMNGIAILLMFKQVRPLLGVEEQIPLIHALTAPGVIDARALVVGLITIGTVFTAKHHIKRIPPTLVALLVGTGALYLMAFITGRPVSDLVIGGLPVEMPAPTAIWSLFNGLPAIPLGKVLPEILFTSLVISILASMESMLSSVVCDQMTMQRHNSRRELIGQGIGNMTASLFGSLPGAGSIPRAVLNYHAGGRTKRSGMLCSIIMLLIVSFGGAFVGKIPFAAVAGIVFVVGFNLFDKWTFNLIRKLLRTRAITREEIFDIAIIGFVAFITILVNLIVAVGVGMVVASALFIAKTGRSSIRRLHYGNQIRSRRMRSAEQITWLEEHGGRIVVLVLQGPIFFGSAESLANQIQTTMARTSYLILDFKRATDIDRTAAGILLQLKYKVSREGKRLLFSNLQSNRAIWPFLETMGLALAFEADDLFPDTDTALECAENSILGEIVREEERGGVAFSRLSLFKGFAPGEMKQVGHHLTRQAYGHGEAVFKENDTDRDLYILMKGLMTVKIYLPGRERQKRLYTYAPGTIFGEMSFLDGSPRSATVWAREGSETLCLPYAHFQALQAENPDLATKLVINIALEISQRLRRTTHQLREVEDQT